MKDLILLILCAWTALSVSSVLSVSITPPGDVIAGRPLTLECRVNRTKNNNDTVSWESLYGYIYTTAECTASIPVRDRIPYFYRRGKNGITGGCQHVNGEEVYTVTINSVTEDFGRLEGYDEWMCRFGSDSDSIVLIVKVMVTLVNMTRVPGRILAGHPSNFTCVASASKPPACVRGYIREPGNVREIDPPYCEQGSYPFQGTKITTRTLTFTASAEENGAELYCNASNSVTDPPVRSQVYTLNVQYPPNVTCNQVKVTSFEGQRVNISCEVRANPKATIMWVKNKRQSASRTLRDLRKDDVTISTLEFEEVTKSSSGIYVIEATNSIGSSRTEVEISVIDDKYLPRKLMITSCINNKASLVWASGIDDSLVEYYKLEYKGTDKEWTAELIRNPGLMELVVASVQNLQPEVLYQFRLQPNSDVALSEYVEANCKTEKQKQALSEGGPSKEGMFAVGFVAGGATIAIIAVALGCWFRRKVTLGMQNKEQHVPERQDGDHTTRAIEEATRNEDIPSGAYEDLDLTCNAGSQYETLSTKSPPPKAIGDGDYENTTSM